MSILSPRARVCSGSPGYASGPFGADKAVLPEIIRVIPHAWEIQGSKAKPRVGRRHSEQRL